VDSHIFRQIFVEAPIGMVMLGRDGTILSANRAFLRLSGKERVAQSKLSELFIPEDTIAYDSAFERLDSRRIDSFSTELRYRSNEDGEKWVRMNMYPLKTVRQGLLVAFFEDVSEQKHREYQLRRAKEASQKARQAAERETRIKSDFLANMSHEIRTPIHTITGMSELLGDTELDPEQQEYVDQIAFSADVLLSLVNDILDFSKIEAGKLSLESIEFDLQKTVEDAVDLVALEAHKKGLDTAVFVENDVPTMLKGDPVRLRQIIVNLFNNAVKFTQQGEVMVEVKKIEESDEEVVLRFRVNDTGIGIPDEKKNKLFKVFSQVDSSTTRKYGGTGLGLSISKNLTQMMGGDIGVSSLEGQGSTFWFTARLKKQGEENFYRSLPEHYFQQKVLVVDDNENIRRYMCSYLEEWGCRVVQAAGGPEALELLREAHNAGEDFDICLVDLLMPRMDGWQFASEVNADERLVDSNLVLMSPTGKSGDEAKMKLLHWFRDYLSKPVKKSKLFEVIFDVVNLEEPEGAEPELSEAGEAVEMVEEITGGKVLVAEDHEVNQQLFKTILENLGHEVHLANNGAEAVKAVQTDRYDLIFMDVQMPEMNGYEATEAIRALDIQTPIVAVTASALRGEERKSSEVGMNDFLVKPFKKKDLLPVLERWFDQSGRTSSPGPGEASLAAEQEPEELEAVDDAEEPEELEELEELEALDAVDDLGELEDLEPVEENLETKEPFDADDPILDFVETLETFMGQRETVLRVIGSFNDKVAKQIPKILEVLEARDCESLRGEAHSIKGGAMNLNAVRLGKTAAALEQAAADGQLKHCSELVNVLQAEYHRFVEQAEKSSP